MFFSILELAHAVKKSHVIYSMRHSQCGYVHTRH